MRTRRTRFNPRGEPEQAGEDIILRAFGATQTFRNVTSVEYDFGGGGEFRVLLDSRRPSFVGLADQRDRHAGERQ